LTFPFCSFILCINKEAIACRFNSSLGATVKESAFQKNSLKAPVSAQTLTAEISNGTIVLRPAFRHRSLRERAEAYGGQLNISGEFDWGEPVGREIW